MDALQLIHFFLQTFVDLQYTLKFQHLGFKPIDDSLEVDHLIISSNQLFSLCISSERSLWFFLSRHLLSRQGRYLFPPSLAVGSTTVIGRTNASALILFTSYFESSPRFS
ncbi:hypothetical protein TB2_045844 [Malus domestica]